jgi:hypothetical protein
VHKPQQRPQRGHHPRRRPTTSVLAAGNHERGDVPSAQVLQRNPAGPLPTRNKRPDQLHIAPDRRLGKPALGGQPAGIPTQQRLHRPRRPRRHLRRGDLPSLQEPQQRRQRPTRPMAGTPQAATLRQIGVHHRGRQPSTAQAPTGKPPAQVSHHLQLHRCSVRRVPPPGQLTTEVFRVGLQQSDHPNPRWIPHGLLLPSTIGQEKTDQAGDHAGDDADLTSTLTPTATATPPPGSIGQGCAGPRGVWGVGVRSQAWTILPPALLNRQVSSGTVY